VGGKGYRPAKANYPFPGVYSFAGGGLFGILANGKEDDPAADVCYQHGGKMRYAACRDGTPYFVMADASKSSCYR
jgi:hypothetical protein